MSEVARLSGVSKSRKSRNGYVRVLDGLDFEIQRGDKISLVGPNGSGKTTFIRMILGLERPDSGICNSLMDGGIRVSYIPQDYRAALFPWFSLEKNLILYSGSTRRGDSAESEAKKFEALAREYRFDVDLKKYPYQLSGGEQQIFLLIRSLITLPEFLILDEPLSAVDFGRKVLIQRHLSAWLSEEGAGLLFASHDFEEAILLADRIVLMDRNSPKIKTVLDVDLPWPRSLDMRGEPEFVATLQAIVQELV